MNISNPHSWPGIGGIRKPRRTPKQWKEYINNMSLIHKDQPIPPSKIKHSRKPHKKYEFEERRISTELIILLRKLRKQGKVEFWRIENGLPGYHGIPDYFIASLKTKWVGFVELKKPGGIISPAQKKFSELCLMGNINHIFAYSVEEVKKIIL